MAECKDCFHEKVCKYANKEVSSGTTVKETVHECIDYTSKEDVVEVKHGIKHESSISNTGLMCTACFSDVDRDAVFCKYCGAKMDEKV